MGPWWRRRGGGRPSSSERIARGNRPRDARRAGPDDDAGDPRPKRELRRAQESATSAVSRGDQRAAHSATSRATRPLHHVYRRPDREDARGRPGEGRGRPQLVHKIVSNIISDQDNAKKRRLKIDNALVKGKVLSLAGGRELLLALGFQPEGAELVLPQEAPLVKLLQARNAVDDALTAAAARRRSSRRPHRHRRRRPHRRPRPRPHQRRRRRPPPAPPPAPAGRRRRRRRDGGGARAVDGAAAAAAVGAADEQGGGAAADQGDFTGTLPPPASPPTRRRAGP